MRPYREGLKVYLYREPVDMRKYAQWPCCRGTAEVAFLPIVSNACKLPASLSAPHIAKQAHKALGMRVTG